MKKGQAVAKDIDEYIAGFPPKVRALLKQIRAVVRKSAPGAKEKIGYQMPAFDLHGNLVYFAAYKNHIGFYPTSSGIAKFKREIAGYANSKGAVQFPLDQPMPSELIGKIVKFRVQENTEKAKEKAARKRKK